MVKVMLSKQQELKSDESTMFAKYAMGGLTVGIQTSEKDKMDLVTDTESTGIGISYQVNDDLTVSYGTKHNRESNSGEDQEATAVGVSYTMGSMGIGFQ